VRNAQKNTPKNIWENKGRRKEIGEGKTGATTGGKHVEGALGVWIRSTTVGKVD